MSYPLAYFITFRTYGTWLHGDERGSVDRNNNHYNTPVAGENKKLLTFEKKLLKETPFEMNAQQRCSVMASIKDFCIDKNHRLLMAHIRSNHIHLILSAESDPQILIGKIKAYCTQKLKTENPQREKYWSRGGSTKYLWKQEQIVEALKYTAYEQGQTMEYYVWDTHE